MIEVKRLESVFVDCLFKQNEIVNDKPIHEAVYVNGIMHDFGFHKERLESHKNEIQEYVNQMSKEFKEGWSFLNMCMDKEGNLWGQHADCEKLMVLAIALELAEYKLIKKYWHTLPGSMPYISFNLTYV